MEKTKASRQTRAEWEDKILGYIGEKGQKELADLVYSFTQRYPKLHEESRERIALSEGDVDRLIAQAWRELLDRTSEISWQNHWKGEGYTPNYSRLRYRLERLLESGHKDAVVELGREFISRVMEQIGQSHDEGETATAVADCLPVVFESVVKSTLPALQKILFAIKASLQDDYDVLGNEINHILDTPWPPEAWSEVADELATQLKMQPEPRDDYGRNDYRRDQISDWLSTALSNAGRRGELSALFEAEARATNNYHRLVHFLLDERRYEEAERWAKEGIEKTRDDFPDTATSFAGLLCKRAEHRRQWDVVAAHAACEFFDHPSHNTFQEFVAKATKARCGEQVCTAAMRFLETGISPVKRVSPQQAVRGKPAESAWPLPMPDYLEPLQRRSRREDKSPRPYYEVLLELAIAEKRPDDILRWFEKILKSQQQSAAADWMTSFYADRVAEAVATSHLDRALAIYRSGLNANLPRAAFSAYEAAGTYLKRMHPILKSLGRANEWVAMVARLREKYGNRPRFMEVLDKLEGLTILQPQKTRRRR